MPTVAQLKAVISADDRNFQRTVTQAQQAIVRFGGETETSGKKLQVFDRISAAASRGVARSFGTIAAGARGVAMPFRVAGNAVSTLAHRAETFNKRADAVRHKFEQIGRAARTVAGPLTLAGGALARFGMIAGGISAGSLAGVLAGFTQLGRRGVEANLQLQGAQRTFETLFRSGDVARQFMDALKKESLTSAFDFTTLAQLSESLAAFGFQAREIIPTIRVLGDTARGNTEKLQRLVLAFGQIRAKGYLQGEEALQLTEAGIPVRDLLRIPAGTDFADAGLTAQQAIPQLLAGLNRMFGGLQQQATKTLPGIWSNTLDALNDISSRATQRLLGSLTKGAQSLLDTLTKAGSNLVERLGVLFDVAGKALEGIAAKLPGLAQWLEKAFNPSAMKIFFANALGLLQTLAEEFGKFFGVDLVKLTDPKNVNRFFEAIGDGVFNGINTLYGLGRVWDELQVIVAGWVTNTFDLLKDWAEDVGRTIKGMFLGLEVTVNHFQAALLGAFVSIADSLNGIIRNLNSNAVFRLFNPAGLPEIETQSLVAGQMDAVGRAGAAVYRVGELRKEEQAARQARQARERRKDLADPFRHQPFGQRIADAFTGRNRDTSAQDDFWKRFDRNRLNVARFLFAGTNPAVPSPGTLIPQTFLGRYPDERRGRTGVFNSNRGEGGVIRPAVPAFQSPVPAWTPPAYPVGYDPSDPYRPVTLPDGATTTAFLAGAVGASFSDIRQTIPPSPIGLAPGGAAMSSGGVQVTNNQVTIETDGRELTRADFEEFYRLYLQARRRESTEAGRLAPSRGFVR